MDRDKFIIFLVVIFLVFAYHNVVFENSKQYLYEFKQMVSLSSSSTELNFNFPVGLYFIKIKHKIESNRSKVVVFNNEILMPYRIRKKKIIETDYFYIKPNQIRSNNLLQINFLHNYPQDIDVRIANFIPNPSEVFSDDLFILFKTNVKNNNFKASKSIFLFLLFILIFIIVLSFIGRKLKKAESYLITGSCPFIFFLIIIYSFNSFPVNNYMILMTPFFFFSLFFLTLFLTLIFVIPKYSLEEGAEILC